MINLKENYSLTAYNTFKLDVATRYFLQFNSISELLDVHKNALSELFDKHSVFVIGQGSNVLFTKYFDGIVIHPQIQNITLLDEDKKSVLVKVGAGIIWDDFVAYCVRKNWYGVENLSYIPGTVGASPVQNIGAYGSEVGNVVEFIEYVDLQTWKTGELSKKECCFAYRDSVFKRKNKKHCLITQVAFRLTKNGILKTGYGNLAEELESQNAPNTLQAVRNTIISIRKQKLANPDTYGNAGSFFKNPVIEPSDFSHLQERHNQIPYYKTPDKKVKIPAAWLIEQCGWKGKNIGRVGIYYKQPLVLINLGNATGGEVMKVAEAIQESIYNRFGITLETEVNIL